MSTLSLTVANDISNAVLKFYARGPALIQTMQDRPLLRSLTGGKKNFPGGNQYVSDPVKGDMMSAQTSVALGGGSFFQGYQEDDSVAFAQAQNIQRAEYKWYECHAGLVITWTELKKDGITIADHSMLWNDGTQDAKQIPGVTAILPDTTGSGTTGTLNRATFPWWNHRVNLGLAVSASGQNLSKFLRAEQRQLRRYGGRPSVFLCGTNFITALEVEVAEKGYYTFQGFVNKGENDIGMADIALRGVGSFQYDPTLDDLGRGKYCYELDTRRLRLRDMEGEWNKVLTPERPYQYMIFLKSMTVTGALQATQLNCHGVYSIA